jgi:signal recognition particle receptor subunit beta
MPHISFHNKEISFKIVYFGPGWSGKTTNLVRIHARVAEEMRGDLVMLDTDQERTLFFDFLPMELGRIAGYAIRLNLYTVPGQIYYEASRRLILDGADGVVFVADSQPSRLDANLLTFSLLRENLESYGVEWRNFPIVLQYNKRDVEAAIAVGTLERDLGLNGITVVEAVAVEGRGVMETIAAVSRQVIDGFDL